MSEVEDMIKALDAGMTKVADVNRDLREENEQLREDLRLAAMSDTEYCKAIEDDNKQLREALKNIVEACEDVNSPDKKVREENFKYARVALKSDDGEDTFHERLKQELYELK